MDLFNLISFNSSTQLVLQFETLFLPFKVVEYTLLPPFIEKLAKLIFLFLFVYICIYLCIFVYFSVYLSILCFKVVEYTLLPPFIGAVEKSLQTDFLFLVCVYCVSKIVSGK